MNRNLIRSAIFGVLLLLGASMAPAQELANLGELLDKGGKRLDAAELKELLTGATTIGTTFGGKLDVETTFASNGKASGRFWGLGPETSPFFQGTWSINEQGQTCVDMVANATFIGRFKNCSPYYMLNNVHYIAASGDRNAVVRVRKLKR